MMQTPRLSLALPLLALLAGPALASPCSDKIAALDGRVKDQAAEAISASTGSKTIAAHREGEGQTGTGGQTDKREAPPEKSAEAGKGGDQAQQAKVAVEEARTADGKGDAKGCEEAVQRAEKLLDAKP
ncbi:hypothetical protein [Methylorubrum suomiense]|uniref:Uncharacterized protein n=1 Tax=Methylorubrum suomiense TaxID=144191 RepID=A0ABQ4UVL4_9HYPH|nr:MULTISPECIES: hypothetical protein [Methylobacteriaceae]GJE76257.1 hypothetical protein BGCPKDLD_2849 [Methylorubrum suomiense]